MTPGGFAIFVNGSYGVGKSAVLDHLGDLLAAAGRPFALMDVDWFHRSWPPAVDDPDNHLIEAANMAAAWANYRRAGSRQLIVAGVLSGSADRARYEQALMMPVRSVRLEATVDVAERRLHNRYDDHRLESLRWHLARHVQLSQELRVADLDECVLETSTSTPAPIARKVMNHFA